MEDNDMAKSVAENRASDEVALQPTLADQARSVEDFAPNSDKILHDELVYGLRRVCHIHFPLSISEIGLFHDIGEGRGVIQVKTL